MKDESHKREEGKLGCEREYSITVLVKSTDVPRESTCTRANYFGTVSNWRVCTINRIGVGFSFLLLSPSV